MSSSKSSSATSTENRDGRVAADNGALGISADGPVTVHMVQDELIQMGIEALDDMASLAQGAQQQSERSTEIVAGALTATQQANKSEAGQISEQFIKMAVPAAAIAFIASRVF